MTVWELKTTKFGPKMAKMGPSIINLGPTMIKLGPTMISFWVQGDHILAKRISSWGPKSLYDSLFL